MRKLTLQQATARYVHRYTMDHVPAWAAKPAPNGKFCAPQFRSDQEWYDHTKFKGEEGYFGSSGSCYTTGPTWPLGDWLDAPFKR